MSEPAALGRPRLHLRETDSTNTRARELAAAGAPHGALVTAAAQTAGRGRLGRSWVAPAGSAVLASLVLRPAHEVTALLPLAAPVAVCEACERAAPVECMIKWPNDVWVDGRKLAGILLEGRPQEGWAVLGVGINVASVELPAELRESATSLASASAATAAAGREPTVEGVLGALLAALERWMAATAEQVVEAWSARDALRGRPIRWDGGEGVAEGIDRSGALLVASEGGRRVLSAGEVALVRPERAAPRLP